MNARLLFMLLVIALLLAFSRRYRQVGLGLSAVLLLLLLWAVTHVEQDTGQLVNQRVASSSSASSVPLAAQLSAITLEGNGAPWRLSGRVENSANTPMRVLTVDIERLDCPDAAALPADCTLLWRGTHVARIDIAAGASAKLDERFYSHEELPRLQGVARDHITLVAAN